MKKRTEILTALVLVLTMLLSLPYAGGITAKASNPSSVVFDENYSSIFDKTYKVGDTIDLHFNMNITSNYDVLYVYLYNTSNFNGDLGQYIDRQSFEINGRKDTQASQTVSFKLTAPGNYRFEYYMVSDLDNKKVYDRKIKVNPKSGEFYSCVNNYTQAAISSNLTKPMCAWSKTAGKLYDSSESYQVRLEQLYLGDTASGIVSQNTYNDPAGSGDQWLVMKFYLKNTGKKELYASRVIDSNIFYTSKGASMVIKKSVSLGNKYKGMSQYDLTLQSGASGCVWVAILVPKSAGYPLLRLKNGYDNKNWENLYTWVNTNPKYSYTLNKVSITSIANTSAGVNLKWKKVNGASGYLVYRKTGSGKYTKIATINKNATVTSFTDKKAGNGTNYTYAVKAYNGTLTSAISTKAITFVKNVNITRATNVRGRSLSATWSKNAKASGYQIHIKSGRYSKTYNVSARTTRKTFARLTKNKTYSVRVRAYKTVAGKKVFSTWSAFKNVRITR